MSSRCLSPSLSCSHHTGRLAGIPGMPPPWGLGVGCALCSRVSFLWLSFHSLIPSSLLRWHLCSGAFPDIPFKIAISLPLHSPASLPSFSVSLSSGQLLLSLLWSISHLSPRHQPNAWPTVGTQQSAISMSGELFLPSRCLGFCGAQCWAQSGHPCGISTVVSLSLGRQDLPPPPPPLASAWPSFLLSCSEE